MSDLIRLIPERTRPVYNLFVEAGKFPLVGIIPSAMQGTMATVHLLASVISLAAIKRPFSNQPSRSKTA